MLAGMCFCLYSCRCLEICIFTDDDVILIEDDRNSKLGYIRIENTLLGFILNGNGVFEIHLY